jgi:hypothetical protein
VLRLKQFQRELPSASLIPLLPKKQL